MNSFNISNKIKQPALCCIHCGKSYIKRVNLDKHSVICELLNNSKKSKLVIEEDDPLPSQRKMFQMLIELGMKFNKLEENMEEINKWVVKKKKKINVLEWLNANMTPNIVFDSISPDVKNIEYMVSALHVFNKYSFAVETILSFSDGFIDLPLIVFLYIFSALRHNDDEFTLSK